MHATVSLLIFSFSFLFISVSWCGCILWHSKSTSTVSSRTTCQHSLCKMFVGYFVWVVSSSWQIIDCVCFLYCCCTLISSVSECIGLHVWLWDIVLMLLCLLIVSLKTYTCAFVSVCVCTSWSNVAYYHTVSPIVCIVLYLMNKCGIDYVEIDMSDDGI